MEKIQLSHVLSRSVTSSALREVFFYICLYGSKQASPEISAYVLTCVSGGGPSGGTTWSSARSRMASPPCGSLGGP